LSGTTSRPDHAAELRRQAEEIARDNAAKSAKHVEALSLEETQHMLHELQVHQIELEMQNEELHKAQVELDAGRARYFDLYDLAPVGYVTISEQGLLLEANLTTTTLLGVTRNELIKQPFSRFVFREDQDICYFLNKQLFETGEPHGCELRMVKKDGTAFWVRLQATSVQDAAGLAVSRVVISDITERKQAEETLHNERLLLRTLIDNIPDSIYSKDLACRKTLANSTEVCYLGVKSEADVLGKDDFDIYPKELAEKFFADDQLVLQTGEPVLNREEYILDEKRQKHWLLTSKLPLRNQEGRIIGLVGIGRDITERKQAEAQLRQSQKMEAIGELAGGVAHDFNNLLTGILGSITLMRSSLPPADPLLENLDAAETAARQAADLTRGLLTFSRSAVILPVPMSITVALDATLALLKQSLPASMEIVRDYERTAWNVLLDQTQMTQILLNLTVNARDAMKGKGTLTIRTSNEVVGEKYVQTHPFARTGEFVHLSVTDTGPGMSSEVMQHLFEPFYTTKPIGSGTGLGLSIVYGAVKQAGGWITAVSTEGVGKNTPHIGQTCSGATFDIYLPRCLEESTQSFTPSPPSLNVRGGTVLVVEDEPVVCAVAQALLSRSGYTVLTAPDGASALNILRDHPAGIGLILLDMTMPGMTTDDIVQAIRALDPKVPILLNSGYTSNDTVKRMLAEGTVQGFLPKPYELHELLDTVDQLMKRT
jgi:PAS domain S-box-containing protein